MHSDFGFRQISIVATQAELAKQKERSYPRTSPMANLFRDKLENIADFLLTFELVPGRTAILNVEPPD